MKSFAKFVLSAVAGLALVGFAAPDAQAAVRPAASDDGKPAPPHTHVWVKQTRKEWVPPVKQTVQVGVDAKGKPVYETKIVKPGYWRTIVSYSCSCGATKQ
jgi:hypothetical protein